MLEFDDIRRRVVDRQLFIVDEGMDRADDADMVAGSRRIWAMMWVVVVLPLVPVTPIMRIFLPG